MIEHKKFHSNIITLDLPTGLIDLVAAWHHNIGKLPIHIEGYY